MGDIRAKFEGLLLVILRRVLAIVNPLGILRRVLAIVNPLVECQLLC